MIFITSLTTPMNHDIIFLKDMLIPWKNTESVRKSVGMASVTLSLTTKRSKHQCQIPSWQLEGLEKNATWLLTIKTVYLEQLLELSRLH